MLVTVAGLLAGANAGARAAASGAAVSAGLPNPGPLLAAPTSLKTAEAEIAPVLAQAQNPKTALLGTLRLLVNSGVSILNGAATVYRGRKGGPPLFMQAGAVVALSQDINGPGVTAAHLLKVYAAGDVTELKTIMTPAFYGKNFAAEITAASGASEYLWAASLVRSDTSAKGLVASLNGAGTPADTLVPLQVQLLSLRLQVDALASAYALRPPATTPLAAPAAGQAGPPCNLDTVPEWLSTLVSSGYNHGIEAAIKHGGFAKGAEAAERYGSAMGIGALAATVANSLLLLFAMDVTSNTTHPLVRTTSTTSDGGDAILNTTFTWPTSSSQWLNCARIILNLTGFDGSVPGHVIKNAEVTWTLDSASASAARLINDTANTNANGTASTVIEGRRQPYDLGQPIKYTREIGFAASINPRSTRSAGDLLISDCITAAEGVIGVITNNWVGVVNSALQLAMSLAEEYGLLRRSNSIDMTDWHAFPTSFSASFTFDDPQASGYKYNELTGTMTIPKTHANQTDGISYYESYPMQGSMKWIQSTDQYCNWSGSATGTLSLAISAFATPPGFGAVSAQINSVMDKCGGSMADTFMGSSNSLWAPGMTSSTISVIDPAAGTGQKVGTFTFHWYYN